MVKGSGETPPIVSVVLPTHNRADVLPFAVSSVLYQSFPDFELLIAADGCTDDTAEVVAGFDDDRIRWFDLPKAPGFGYANRNIVLRQARGEFIAYMPHDDLWLVDHLAHLVRLAHDRDADFVHSRKMTVDRQGRMWPSPFNLEAAATLAILTPSSLAIGIAPVLHRRDCLDRFGYWDESGRLGGDHRLWVDFIGGGSRSNFAFLAEPTSLHFLADWREQNLRRWHIHYRELTRRMRFDLQPDILHVLIPDGMTEQQAVWARISENPRAFVQELRAGVQASLDSRLMRLDDFLPMALAVLGTRLRRFPRAYFNRLEFGGEKAQSAGASSPSPTGRGTGTRNND